jgi:hypothetical protein
MIYNLRKTKYRPDLVMLCCISQKSNETAKRGSISPYTRKLT